MINQPTDEATRPVPSGRVTMWAGVVVTGVALALAAQ